MPIYEYECGNCHNRFELKQGFDAKPSAECPQCQEKSRRVIYAPPLLFKGSGFYITDSRRNSEPGKTKESPAGQEDSKGKKSNEGTAPAGQPGLG